MDRKIAVISMVSVGLLFWGSCAKKTITPEQTIGYYQKGEELYKKGEYGGAAEYLEKAQMGIAYLSPQKSAELKYKLALAYYKEEKYTDAILTLEEFIATYPTSPKVEEAYLYLIKAYLKISPDEWRDPTYIEKAIALAQEFLQKFPNSPYRSEVEKLLKEAYRKLAKHHYLIGLFYEEYGHHYPAVTRFEYLLVTFPEYINERETVFHYIKNLYLTPRYAKRKIEEWRKKYEELKEEIEENEVEDKKAAQKRLQFYKQQMERWKGIADWALKTADENLEIYKQKYGEDNYYKLLLKIKESVKSNG